MFKVQIFNVIVMQKSYYQEKIFFVRTGKETGRYKDINVIIKKDHLNEEFEDKKIFSNNSSESVKAQPPICLQFHIHQWVSIFFCSNIKADKTDHV